MIKIKLQDIRNKAKSRPSGYYETVVSKGTIDGNVLLIEPAAYQELLKQYNTTPEGDPIFSCCGRNNKRNDKQYHNLSITSSQQLPSLSTQLRNVTKAAISVGKDIVGGREVFASNEEIQRRKLICETCEFFIKGSKKCSKCGCYYEMKTKLKSQRCPLTPPKW